MTFEIAKRGLFYAVLGDGKGIEAFWTQTEAEAFKRGQELQQEQERQRDEQNARWATWERDLREADARAEAEKAEAESEDEGDAEGGDPCEIGTTEYNSYGLPLWDISLPEE